MLTNIDHWGNHRLSISTVQSQENIDDDMPWWKFYVPILYVVIWNVKKQMTFGVTILQKVNVE